MRPARLASVFDEIGFAAFDDAMLLQASSPMERHAAP